LEWCGPDLFDLVICMVVDDETLRHRLQTRTTNASVRTLRSWPRRCDGTAARPPHIDVSARRLSTPAGLRRMLSTPFSLLLQTAPKSNVRDETLSPTA